MGEVVRLDGLVEEIQTIEEQIAQLRARQVLVTAELVEGCRVLEFGRAGRSSTASQTSVAMQVATADAGGSRGWGDQLGGVRAVVHEAVNVPFELVGQFDQMVADDLLEVPVMSQARAAARRRAFELNLTPRSQPPRSVDASASSPSTRRWESGRQPDRSASRGASRVLPCRARARSSLASARWR
jgi:hypothetical protein